MKRPTWMFLVVLPLLVNAGGAAKFRVENDMLVVDSPFDFVIGSTVYAKRFPNRIRSNASATYDPQTKVTTTNWYYFATARLAKPYFGCTSVSLSFKGKERRLERVMLHEHMLPDGKNGMLSPAACRERVVQMAQDIKKRSGLSLEWVQERTEDEILEEIKEETERSKSKGERISDISMSFISYNGEGMLNGVATSLSLCGLMDKRKRCGLSLSISEPWRSPSGKEHIPVYTNSTCSSRSAFDPTPEQKKAHAEAAQMRATLKRLFAVVFDASAATNGFSTIRSGSPSTNDTTGIKREWTPRDTPFEGMTEQRSNIYPRALQIPVGFFSLRRAWEGDVTEDELKAQSRRFLDRFEKEHGAKIPEANRSDTEDAIARIFGANDAGTPTFGDTRTAFVFNGTQFFRGKIGDLTLTISYSTPRYAKKGEAYEIVLKGAVVVNVVQSPIFIDTKSGR